LGELLAMGIPVICNREIGDVDDIIINTKGGVLINDFSCDSFENGVENLVNYLSDYSPSEIRERSKKYYDLNDGIEKYKKIYQRLLN
jgi:glycosyltransferase involved in cell wall biosynthesis